MQMPQSIGAVHFVGLGGIGMSAIAEVLLHLGYKVQGSDMKENANVIRLKKNGAKTFIGHDGANVAGAGVLVVSSAIKPDNPELVAARAGGIPIVLRAEMLAELMRLKAPISIAGTHGKTTTTSYIASVLSAGKIDPTVINGGVIAEYGSNARLGKGPWLVAEADESDGSFLRLPTQIGVVTNIDPEHMEHYGSFDALMTAFEQFVSHIPFYGLGILGIDHPNVRTLWEGFQGNKQLANRPIVTFGESPDAKVRMVDFKSAKGQSSFTAIGDDRAPGGAFEYKDIILPMPGHYNGLNALAAICVARHIGVQEEAIRRGLGEFQGVDRRFSLRGIVNDISYYDDYAHHPVEIASVLKAAKSATEGRVITIMQPHRYTRLSDHFDEFAACFQDADEVILAPVYTAGEAPIKGIHSKALAAAVKKQGKNVHLIKGEEDLPGLIGQLAGAQDFIIGVGAGTITSWMRALPSKMEQLNKRAV